MAGKRMSTKAIIAVAILTAACSGCSFTTEGTAYDIGVQAVMADPSFPKDATIGSFRSCSFYVGKSAACVEIPYFFSREADSKPKGVYVVWLKRIGTRWELDRLVQPSGTAPAGTPWLGQK